MKKCCSKANTEQKGFAKWLLTDMFAKWKILVDLFVDISKKLLQKQLYKKIIKHLNSPFPFFTYFFRFS